MQNSLWGGDLEAFMLQSAPRELLSKMPNIMHHAARPCWNAWATRSPDGTIIGARGPNGPFAPPTALNKWFQKAFKEKFGVYPVYASYHMATAFFGAKAAYEKAQASNKGEDPSIDQIIAAFEYLKFESRRRHGGHVAGQGTPGRAARRLRHGEKGGRQGHDDQHQVLPARTRSARRTA